MALCDRCWGHFAAADGQMPADGSRQWLPRQLGAALRECGKRGGSIRLARESPHGTAAASLQARCVIRGRLRKHARQLAHTLADAHGLQRGRGTECVARYGTQPKTVAEFQDRRPPVGGFAATPPAARSHFVHGHPRLAEEPYWFWRIRGTYQSGDAFPVEVSGRTVAAELTYEVQLYAPTVNGKLVALWDEMPIAASLRTAQEKQKRRIRRLRQHGVINKKAATVKAPLVAYLRSGKHHRRRLLADGQAKGAATDSASFESPRVFRPTIFETQTPETLFRRTRPSRPKPPRHVQHQFSAVYAIVNLYRTAAYLLQMVTLIIRLTHACLKGLPKFINTFHIMDYSSE